jgi:glycosyltransferase involved in cell wall biosynthesis
VSDPIARDGREPRALKLLSVVAAAYNEEATIEPFYKRVCSALDGLPFEIVVVDDGSGDSTPAILDRLASTDPRFRVISLSRNFGFQRAVSAALDHARGNVVVTIDVDLQDPPEVILALLEKWRSGADVVYAVREARPGETRLKLASARWFSRIFARLTQLRVPENVGDFRLLDRRPLDALLSMRERARFLRGLVVWVGFTQATVPYERNPRFAGSTKYTWRGLVRVSLDAISSFSHVPLQAAAVLGFFISGGVLLIGIPYVIIERIAGVYVPGVSTVLVAVLLLGGIQLITLGLIGEYIAGIYEEVKQRPLYVVRARRNLQGPFHEGDRIDKPAESVLAEEDA